MKTIFVLLIILISVVFLAAVSAAFISVYEKFFDKEPNRFVLVIVNLCILSLTYFFVVSPLIN